MDARAREVRRHARAGRHRDPERSRTRAACTCPDIFMFKPVFAGDHLLGYAVVVAHHNDIGGRVPGSSAADSTEIFQEGLRIPILKLYERGVAEPDAARHDRAQRAHSRRRAGRPAGAGGGLPHRRARHGRARRALRRRGARGLFRRAPRLQRARGAAHDALDSARASTASSTTSTTTASTWTSP